MGDLTFSSYRQGPLGEAIETAENFGTLPAPSFAPAVTLIGPGDETALIAGPRMRLLGPGDVVGLPAGTIIRRDPPPGAVDVEANYLAAVEVVPAELPWVLTPARAANGRLRPWLVLVVLKAATAPVVSSDPLPYVEAEIAQLPDLRDSWGWAHVQTSEGDGPLPGGATASASALARLLCPRRLESGVTYRACLVPAFDSGRAAGLGETPAGDGHQPAWSVENAGTVRLPVYDTWTFTTGSEGDFEELVTRLRPADKEQLRVSSVRPVDIRAPWPGDAPLSEQPQLVAVAGALCTFDAPPAPEPPAETGVTEALEARLRAHLDAPAQRLLPGGASGAPGTLAPPLYGGRHVLQDRVESALPWIGQLNANVPNRIAAALGAAYVRAHQEELMAKAWEQVGAIREANRRRAAVQLTTAVAERIHRRHVARLTAGELVAFTGPAQARTKTSDDITLALELRVSRLPNGVASAAFARRVRPRGTLARRAGVSVAGIIPRGLAGEVVVPAGNPVIAATPAVDAAGVRSVISTAAASQLMAVTAMARVAALNGVAEGSALQERVSRIDPAMVRLATVGDLSTLSRSITDQVGVVTETTADILADLTDRNAYGPLTPGGVPISADVLAHRVAQTLHPGDSHFRRLASQTVMPAWLTPSNLADPVMAYPRFPVPVALALLDIDPEWFLPGLGRFPTNRVALLRQNSEFIESYLVGINHEMMRELLWREYPTDQRGTPFTTFWPRPDGGADINPLHTWTDSTPLGDRLLQDKTLTVLLVRGDVVRRFPGMVVTAVRSGPPDDHGRHRPDPAVPAVVPQFMIRIDEQTIAYAFPIPESELMTPASVDAPGWFFVFAENGYRIRFGFDTTESPPLDPRGHVLAGAPFGPADGDPRWNHDAADIARITLQRPFRVAIQADVLLNPDLES